MFIVVSANVLVRARLLSEVGLSDPLCLLCALNVPLLLAPCQLDGGLRLGLCLRPRLRSNVSPVALFFGTAGFLILTFSSGLSMPMHKLNELGDIPSSTFALGEMALRA